MTRRRRDHGDVTPIIFWDEDTQRDFMEPDGALYVAGAEGIVANLDRLTRCARTHAISVIAVMCDHTDADPEISAHPDYHTTFPPHCMRGTRGQERIAATAPQRPLYFENRAYERAEVARQLRAHAGEIVIKKQALDPFSNPATDIILNVLAPQRVVVYGVCTDFCVNQAIVGLTDRNWRVRYVADACRAINPAAAAQCEESWRGRGVEFVTTAHVIAGVEGGRPDA